MRRRMRICYSYVLTLNIQQHLGGLEYVGSISMKRPLLAVTLLHSCGILAAELLSPPLWPLLGLLLLLAGVAVSCPRFRLLLLYPLLVLSGLANSALHTAILSPTDL